MLQESCFTSLIYTCISFTKNENTLIQQNTVEYWEEIMKREQKQHYLYNYCIELILKAITMQLNLIVWTIIEYITKKRLL